MDENPNAAAPLKPRHRRYQFRLRTLLIVVTVLAVPCGYIARQLAIVHHRKAVWAKVIDLGGNEGLASYERSPLPRIRQWLGDIPKAVIELPDSARADETLIRSAFPESHVLFMPPGVRFDGQMWTEHDDPPTDR